MPPRRRPGAKQKLNAANLLGIAVVAAAVGLLTGSPGLGVVTAVVLLIAAVHGGDVR